MNVFLFQLAQRWQPTPSIWRQRCLGFCLLPLAFCLLSACTRAPQTAEELQKALPSQYRGELHLQGEVDSHRIVLEPLEMSVKDTHSLEFKQVRYQFFNGNSVAAEGDANVRGVISTPDLIIHLDQAPGEFGDMLKAGSFEGRLSKNLKEIEATWKTGFGQSVRLKVKTD